MASQKKSRTKRPGASPFFSNIPLRLRVRPGRSDYSVVPLPKKAEATAWGDTDHSNKTIRLAPGMRSKRLADTVIHELSHAVLGEHSAPTIADGIQAILLADPRKAHYGTVRTLNVDLEETIVHTMATGLLQVLIDNPDFRRWLFDLIDHVGEQESKAEQAAASKRKEAKAKASRRKKAKE